MREYVEKLIGDYPSMLANRAALKNYIESYVPVTMEDLISAMTFSQPDGDRVQSSGVSDKTCSVALCFRERAERINEEAIGAWVKEYKYLMEEIDFFEDCIRRLPLDLSVIMTVLVLDGTTWDEAEGCLHMSRKAISCRRNEAIGMMTVWYQERASRMEAVMLS